MNITNRWKEYDAKTLTPPCVVQHDVVGEEHLVWVWTGKNILQASRTIYNEAEIISDMVASEIIQTEPYEIECEDGVILNMEIPV